MKIQEGKSQANTAPDIEADAVCKRRKLLLLPIFHNSIL